MAASAASEAVDRRRTLPIGFDRRLVAPGPARLLVAVHRLLAAAMAFRLVERPWWQMTYRPDALFKPVWVVSWMTSPPSTQVLLVAQVAGVAGGVAAVLRRAPRIGFAIAWIALVFVAACWGSSGKVMHNEVLLITVAFPLLFSAVPGRGTTPASDVRWGWGPRASTAALGAVYFATGLQKLRHSGLRWAISDNMSWVVFQGRSPFGADLNLFIARQHWLTVALASGALLFELGAPLLLWFRRTRIIVPVVAFVMHTSIWVLLGLNYSSWVLTCIAVAVPMSMRWDEGSAEVPLYRRVALPWNGRDPGDDPSSVASGVL
ncbi:MAG: HTTM domain-containing protein [Acidimicrobiales bacterium]|nr:HTTM domain-containing protein [Acidimicrobiales bacterium]